MGTIHPRAHWALDFVDLSSYLQGSEKDVKVRLYWTAHHKVDCAGLIREVPAQIHPQSCCLQGAVHSAEGSVVDRLEAADQFYAELVPQDTLTLSFSFEPVVGDSTRDFMLVARGHYVTGDSTGGGPLPKAISITRPEMPSEFSLTQNCPNPLNPETRIQYSVISVETSPYVTLRIFNVLGREVKTLVDRPQEAGYYEVTWDGTDSQGKGVTSGIYFYRLTAGSSSETKKMVLMR